MPLVVLRIAWLLALFITTASTQQYYEVDVRADAPENVFLQVQVGDRTRYTVTHFLSCSTMM